jgi:phosphoribosylaminoimidazole-succinocarboxamide synthase
MVADLPLLSSGKVREMYALGEQIVMVASDRVSTYDAVHPTPIPDKGKVLTGLSHFWFERTRHICANHLISATEGVPEEVRGRALTVQRLEMLPVECVARGYLTGSGWKDYQRTGAVCGVALPPGLEESARLPEPIFTPATKAAVGDHDENVSFEQAVEIVGDRELMEELRRLSLELYSFALDHAVRRGVILADTKFEFGRDGEGRLVLGDEALTPDSSRFWPAEGYAPGRPQPSFDKQIVRDWATSTGWDKSPPAPPIPDEVVARTRERYLQAYELITGEPFDAWLAHVAG